MTYKYNKQLLEEFHKQNHTHIHLRVSSINPNIPFIAYYNNLSIGVYNATFNNKQYLFNIQEHDVNLKYDANNVAYYIKDGKRISVPLYRMDKYKYFNEKDEIILKYTVNDYIDQLIFSGISELKLQQGTSIQSIEYPADIISCDYIEVTTKNESGTKADKLILDLKNNIKKLPNGVVDMFIMDATRCNAYCLFNIGRLILTGNEDWKIIDELSTDNYTVFFYNFDLAKIQERDDDYSVVCSHFVTKPFSKFTNKQLDTNSAYITLGDSNYNGFLVSIPKSILEKDVIKFKNFLSTKFRIKPIIIEYELKNVKTKSVLLDEYHVKTYFPKTIVSFNIGSSQTAILYKSINNR